VAAAAGAWRRLKAFRVAAAQVLESCSALLETSQIPVDGIVRLLQHILRPHQQELQQWAAHLLQVGGLGSACRAGRLAGMGRGAGCAAGGRGRCGGQWRTRRQQAAATPALGR
jgi:hypothetical protein